MRQPNRYLWRMIGFLAAVAGIVWLLKDRLLNAIASNPPLNMTIIAVLVIGILYMFGQILNLRPEIKWLNKVRNGEGRGAKTPRLLGPLSRLMGEDAVAAGMSPGAARATLDSLGSRLDETRDIGRYMVGLLVFLGLLGTFWGLLQTVTAVVDTIRSLSVGAGPIEESFETLRLGLEAPLGGMATAFSSSLIGLGGSLILGFLDIQMVQAQNHFHNGVEEWLSEYAYLQGGTLEYEAGTRLGGNDGAFSPALDDVARKLAVLTRHIETEHQVMMKLAEAQARLLPMLERLADPEQIRLQNQYTEAIYGHLRNLDDAAQQLSQGSGTKRDEVFWELKKEVARLTQTLKSLSHRE